MTARQASQYEMFVRVGKFAAAHREQFPDGSPGAKVFATVATAAEQIRVASMSKLTAKQEGRRRRAAAKRAVIARIEEVARFARLIARAEPGADSRFQLPPKYTDLALSTAAHAFLKEVDSMKATFVEHGMPETLVQDLQKSTETFEQGIDGRLQGKTTVAAAQAAIVAAAEQGMQAARDLDLIIATTLRDDPRAVEQWKRERQTRGAAQRRPTVEPPAAPEHASVAATPSVVELPLPKAS